MTRTKGYGRKEAIEFLDVLKSFDFEVVINLIIDAPPTKWEDALEQLNFFTTSCVLSLEPSSITIISISDG